LLDSLVAGSVGDNFDFFELTAVEEIDRVATVPANGG
jgi:hypothetical protein